MKRLKKETALLLRCIPTTTVTLFVVSVVCMNLLANKTLVMTEWLALDGGILISWLSFMCMDLITKYFGPKASNRIAVLASMINLLTCAIFYIVSIIPSTAADYTAFNQIFGGTWFVLLGSTVAFLVSAVINNFLNYLLGKGFRKNPNGKMAFITRSYISTVFGQFMDNLIFSSLVFTIFAPIFWNGFHWTFLQCVTCALTGAIAEVIMEIIFSPFAFRVMKKWEKEKVGQEYLDFLGR